MIGKDEQMTDIPEYVVLGDGWNAFRGAGPTSSIPVSSCGEENVLCLVGDIYFDQSICVHEFAHAVQGSGGKLPTPRNIGSINLDQRLRNIYNQRVVNRGLWANTYAATNHEEYWAVGAQAYFDTGFDGPNPPNGIYNDINNRTELQTYDNSLHSILRNVFGANAQALNQCPTTSCDCSTFVCPADRVSQPTFCFSSYTHVHGKDGPIPMNQLRVGDLVQVNHKGDYERVYAFGHYDKTASLSYMTLQLHDQQQQRRRRQQVPPPSVIELTRDHMLWVQKPHQSKATMIPARRVRVDDYVVSSEGELVRVAKIGRVNRHDGAFAPFTPSGTIVVNGIVASNYVSLKGETLHLHVLDTSISMQWMEHTFMAPYRLYCSWTNACQEHTGWYLSNRLMPVAKWFLEQNVVVMALISIPLLAYLFTLAMLEGIWNSWSGLIVLCLVTPLVLLSRQGGRHVRIVKQL